MTRGAIITWMILSSIVTASLFRLWVVIYRPPVKSPSPTKVTLVEDKNLIHWDRPTHRIIHVLQLTNAWLRFPEGNVAVCVTAEQWRILTNAYPTNICYDRIEFDKEVPITYEDKLESNQR